MSLIPDPEQTHGDFDERTAKLAAEQSAAESDPFNAAAHKAAATAGIRTGAQAFAGALVTTGGVSQVLTWGDLGAQGIGAGIAVGSALVTGVLAGLGAYALFLGRGVPAAYRA